jgi:hypothetical protein
VRFGLLAINLLVLLYLAKLIWERQRLKSRGR